MLFVDGKIEQVVAGAFTELASCDIWLTAVVPAVTTFTYDESSGYYYDSVTGYYYDAGTQVLTSCSSVRWHCMNIWHNSS